ncbi:MAG TPA: alpha/beta hydrolase fold domain-containing protein [Solirubrobacteraceae bacterium]|nr:alpha/beta hydrolase fold domain-containing protein [Solirubrobacteraceae bacterium]
MLAIASAAAGVASAQAQAPEDFGPYAVQSHQVSIPVPVDPRGPEGVLPSVNAEVYVPVGTGPYPLVQISHAWPGTLREFPLSGWANRLASRGMVVIVSDRRAGSNLTPSPSLDQPADLVDLSTDVNSEDILRVLRWAIAQSGAPSSFLSGQVDSTRVAIAGHSLGAYYATFAAIKAQTEGPALSALVLLDPSDERLGANTLDSSLSVSPQVKIPTIVLASEENQHPVMCNMNQGTDCTLVAPQQYAALTGTAQRLGIKIVGSVHEDVEDPSTQTAPGTATHLQMFERYGMAWIEYWAAGDCTVTSYLNGSSALADQSAGQISIFGGGLPAPTCA